MVQGFIIGGEFYTGGEVSQAERLIFRGKTGAARGDPRMTRLINQLRMGGQRSAAEIQRGATKSQIAEEAFKEVAEIEGEMIERKDVYGGITQEEAQKRAKQELLKDVLSKQEIQKQKFVEQEFLRPSERILTEQGEKTPFPTDYGKPTLVYERIDDRLVTGTKIQEPMGINVEQAFGAAPLTVEKADIGTTELVRGTLTTRRLRGEQFAPISVESFAEFGAGAVTSGIGTLQFGKMVFTQPPSETIVQSIGGVFMLPKKFPKIVETVKQEPYFSAGFVSGELIQAKGIGVAQKGVLKIGDIYRTKGLAELPKEKIIAPEYFKGQGFPTIRKGERAGEFIREFQAFLPEETRPAGFHAAPKPFEKQTIVQTGTSELPGLYIAPRLSPYFLRVTEGEKKLFTFSPLGETLRPTVMRVTPEDVKLVPQVSPMDVPQPGKRTQIKKFFQEEAELGKAYVPFIKTEKEAIITAGTPLRQFRERYFIKFEGRRIPIREYEALGGKKIKGLPTMQDVSKSLSDSRVGRKGIFTPLEVGYSFKYPDYRKLTYYKPIKGYKGDTYKFEYKKPKIDYTPKIKGYDRKIKTPVYDVPYYYKPPTKPPTGVPFVPPYKPPTKPPTDGFKIGLPDIRVSERLREYPRQKRKFVRTPSFAAITLPQIGIKPPKYKKELEVTGLGERTYYKPQELPQLGAFKI